MDESVSPLRIALRSVRPFLIFRPHTGWLWLDAVLLLLVSALHFTILPTLLGKLLVVDLLTPWLLTYFVVAPFKKSLTIGVLAALIMETHSSAPAGLYLSLYWVALVTLWLVRVSLSWRHAFPWFVTFCAGEAWIIFSEYFVHSVNLSSVRITLTDLTACLLRLGLAVVAGMMFCRKYRIYGLPEDNPV
jgi:hypothetical protein